MSDESKSETTKQRGRPKKIKTQEEIDTEKQKKEKLSNNGINSIKMISKNNTKNTTNNTKVNLLKNTKNITKNTKMNLHNNTKNTIKNIDSKNILKSIKNRKSSSLVIEKDIVYSVNWWKMTQSHLPTQI